MIHEYSPLQLSTLATPLARTVPENVSCNAIYYLTLYDHTHYLRLLMFFGSHVLHIRDVDLDHFCAPKQDVLSSRRSKV